MEQNAAACGVYPYRNFFIDQTTGEAIFDPSHGIKHYIFHCTSSARSNLAKTVSSLGALRVPVSTAVECCQQGRAKHLAWEHALSHAGDVCYIAYYDPGNAAYAGFMNCLFSVEEISIMCNGSTDPSEELLGDIVEIAVNDLFEKWGGKATITIEACYREIERSFHRYAAVESIMLFPTQNRKRRRPADIIPEERAGIDVLTREAIPLHFVADPADRALRQGEAVQTPAPQPADEPECHAAPEKEIPEPDVAGTQPGEEAPGGDAPTRRS